MTRSTLDEKLDDVEAISLNVRRHDKEVRQIENRMVCAFNWRNLAEANPDMTAEEIASAAASCAESP